MAPATAVANPLDALFPAVPAGAGLGPAQPPQPLFPDDAAPPARPPPSFSESAKMAPFVDDESPYPPTATAPPVDDETPAPAAGPHPDELPVPGPAGAPPEALPDYDDIQARFAQLRAKKGDGE